MALAIHDLCCAACGAKATETQSWGQVLPGEGGEDRPIGKACGPCLEVAGSHWPQMRILSQPPQKLDELQKVIAAKTAKGWWTEQRTSTMQYAMGDVQHGPRLLRISR